MTSNDVKQVVNRHRPAAVFGAAIGLILIVGWFGYDRAMTPTKPVIASAKAAEVVAYISDERGLAVLPQIEQEQFLEQWKDHVAQEGPKLQLKACFDELSDDQRKQFTDAFFRHAKRSFLNDARRYSQLATPEEKGEFLRDRLADYEKQALFTRDVAGSFRSDFGQRPDDIQKWTMEHTTAEERAIGEPYVDALKRVREQVRKEQRVAETSGKAPPAP